MVGISSKVSGLSLLRVAMGLKDSKIHLHIGQGGSLLLLHHLTLLSSLSFPDTELFLLHLRHDAGEIITIGNVHLVVCYLLFHYMPHIIYLHYRHATLASKTRR